MKLHHSIQLKLLAIICIASVGVVIVGLLSMYSLRHMTDKYDGYIQTSAPKIRIIQQALIAMEDANSSLGFALSLDSQDNVEDVNRYESEFNHDMLLYDVFIDALIYGSESEEFRNHDGGIIYTEWKKLGYYGDIIVPPAIADEKNIIEELEINLKQYAKEGQKILSVKRKFLRQNISTERAESNETKKELASLISSVKISREKISKQLERYIAQSDASVKSDIQLQKKSIQSIYYLIIVIIGLNLVGVIIVSSYLMRRFILIPIQRLTRIVNDISIGKFDSKIDAKTLESHDEIGELARAFDRTIVSLKLAMKDQNDKK